MSEKLSQSQEHKSESLDLSVESKRNLERINKEAIEAESQKSEIGELQDSVEKKAKSTAEINTIEAVKNDKYVPGLHKALKQESYKRSMTRVRQRLSSSDKVLSRVVHSKVAEATSEAVGKTAARPSGVLGGGIVAFVGSILLLYVSTHYGFTYNFFVFFILLAAGFIAGVVLELFVRAIQKPRN